jgi:site-specific recombinase XerD
VAISGLRFFYQETLGWQTPKLFLPPRKKIWRLPEVLSQEDVHRLLGAARTLRDRCLLMAAYAAGLRVSELVALKVSDIDSGRMMLRVEQGKGRKDRYTLLSPRLLAELRRYWMQQSGESPRRPRAERAGRPQDERSRTVEVV